MKDVARYNMGNQLEHTVSSALNEVAARQLITERLIKATSQVAELAASEAVYLQAVAKIVSTDLDTAQAVAPILNMAVANIQRINAQFGASL